MSTFEHDIDNLQRVAALAVTNAALLPRKEVLDPCRIVTSRYLLSIQETKTPYVPSHLDTFLAHNKDQFELAYKVYTNVTHILEEECNSRSTRLDGEKAF